MSEKKEVKNVVKKAAKIELLAGTPIPNKNGKIVDMQHGRIASVNEYDKEVIPFALEENTNTKSTKLAKTTKTTTKKVAAKDKANTKTTTKKAAAKTTAKSKNVTTKSKEGR